MMTTGVRQPLGEGDATRPAHPAPTVPPPDQSPAPPTSVAVSYYRTRLLLVLGVAATATLFWVVGRIFGIPHHPSFEASLMFQPAPARALLVTGLTLMAGAGIATVIAGTVRFDAGLFGAAGGLAVLSLRGGPARYVLMGFSGPGGYLLLTIELLLLFAFAGLAWYGLWLLHRRGKLLGDVSRDGLQDIVTTPRDKIFALATQSIVMAVVVLLVAQTDEKKQVLAAVGIGAVAGSMIAYAFSPVRPSVWYWAGPLVVGTVGYLATFLASDAGLWRLGMVEGLFGALARPLPLDYASVGIAGAIFGYWSGRRAHRTKQAAAAEMVQQFDNSAPDRRAGSQQA